MPNKLLKLNFQSNHKHTPRGVEGIFPVSWINTAIYLVEEVVNTDTGFEYNPFGTVDGMGSMEIP